MKYARNISASLAVLALFLPGCATSTQTPSPSPSPSPAAQASPSSSPTSSPGDRAAAKPPASRNVRILRDTWGVPHIYGKTDADAAYGLAFAQCEDDFKTVEEAMIATRSLGGVNGGAQAAAIDYMVHLLGVWDSVNAKYDTDLSPQTRAICEAYADGVNRYAQLHPDEVTMGDIWPVTGKDIVAGFVFKAPFFYGLDNAVLELFGDERKREVSTKTAAIDGPEALAASREFLTGGLPTGSNTFSIGPKRTADGSTFLAVNSHQPWEGPVAWYEAHVHSDEGWEAVGGTFPGVPIVLHGHNRRLGWAHTVNSPDLVDVYVLEINPANKDQYKLDGQWKDFDIEMVPMTVKVGEGVMNIKREVVRSVHGPVLRQPHGVYAIRYAGMGDIRAVEQWYRMNRANNLDQWLDAMKMRAIPSLNCGYADADGNILYLYNALMPIRAEGYDWRQYLPGNTSETIWDDYIPFDRLPMVKNPDSGMVQNCNSTPFQTTVGPGNPDPAAYAPAFGIETHMTNRALRAIETFGADDSIDWDEFVKYKFDTRYSRESFMAKVRVAILSGKIPNDPLAQQAVSVLTKYDLDTNAADPGTALAVMTALPFHNNAGKLPMPDELVDQLRKSADILKRIHGRIDVPWAEVNRLHRGNADLGLGGGPDTLHAVYGKATEDGGRFVGQAGDCYVLLVKWDNSGKVSSQSVHQFGAATTRPASPHYADQAPLFVASKLKPVWFEEADVRAHLEREYVPGE